MDTGAKYPLWSKEEGKNLTDGSVEAMIEEDYGGRGGGESGWIMEEGIEEEEKMGGGVVLAGIWPKGRWGCSGG